MTLNINIFMVPTIQSQCMKEPIKVSKITDRKYCNHNSIVDFIRII